MHRLLKHYDISFVSTGDVLRQEIAQQTEIGRRAEDIVKSGGTSVRCSSPVCSSLPLREAQSV